MAETTYLRAIRLKYGISLLELERHSSLSNQYLSALELGNAKRTEREMSGFSAVRWRRSSAPASDPLAD